MSETTETTLPPDTQLPTTEAAADAAPPPENPRDVMMRRIADRYNDGKRAEEIEFGDALLNEAAPAEEHADAPDAPIQQEVRPDPAPVAPTPVQQPAAPVLRTVDVQGHRFQVTEDQYAQLASTGAIALQAMQQQAYQPAPQQAPAPVQSEPQPILDRDSASAVVQRLAYGSPDDGIAAVQELAGKIAQQVAAQYRGVDPGQIKQAAVQEALQTIQLQSDLHTIGNEFPQIWGSRALTVGAAAELNDLRHRDAMLGVNRPAIELYREACNNVMSQLGPSQPSQSAGDATQPASQAAIRVQPSARLDRKRVAPRNAAGMSRVASFSETAPSAPSPSDIVARMKQQRMQVPN